MRRSPEKKIHQVEILGSRIEVLVVQEHRSSCRASVGKQKLILRMPKGLDAQQQAQTWQWFVEWAERISRDKPQLFNALTSNSYLNQDILKVGRKSYSILIDEGPRRTSSGRLLSGDKIQLNLASSLDELNRSKVIKTLLSRIVAQDFLPGIKERVEEINSRYIGKTVQQVRLTYQHSKWGSCSSLGNINLSTRLLFAPDEVIDYVILHELAHLVEMNHSRRFWEIVGRAMPEFRERERWLRENGAGCDF